LEGFAGGAALLRRRVHFGYKRTAPTSGINAEFTLFRDLGEPKTRAKAVSTRREHCRAMTPGAEPAAGAALMILRGLLLLSAP
jgi:hypothetical protein